MATIEFKDIAHAYIKAPRTAADWAIRDVRHRWRDGGAYALLGPSGCGKTTLLNIISGLLTPRNGSLLFNDRDVTLLPTEKRNIAQVFQFPVVYDTMTVRENLAFPLKNRNIPAARVRTRVDEVAQLLEIQELLEQRASGLAADAKQIVSLGRGIVRDDIDAILFDEPLTVIDPHIKWRLRSSLKRLHRETDFTMIYVTHDQTEALTFADEIAVMQDGQIVQSGTPTELFERPRHTFVGHFIGSPGMNILPCALEDGVVVFGGNIVGRSDGARQATGETQLGVRPEFVQFAADGIPATVRRVRDLGRHRIINLDVAGHAVHMLSGEDAAIPQQARVRFHPTRTYLYENGWLAGGVA